MGTWMKKEFSKQAQEVTVVLKRRVGSFFHGEDLGSEEL